MRSTQHPRVAREQLSDDAGMTGSCRRLRRQDSLHRPRSRILIGDRELRRPHTSEPEMSRLVQAVIKMPLVFALHERGVPVSRIANTTAFVSDVFFSSTSKNLRSSFPIIGKGSMLFTS